jgi:O-glycosyl hydrolase
VPRGTGIDNALFYARMIHFDLTLAQTNAFLYWWLWTGNTNDSSFPSALIMANNEQLVVSHRLYVMGQYSRFIRPGWFRIDCDTTPVRGSGIYSSAYRNPNTNEIAIVVINETISHALLALELTGAEFDRLDIWRTSENERLKSAGRQSVTRNTAHVTAMPRSVTTYYGRVK